MKRRNKGLAIKTLPAVVKKQLSHQVSKILLGYWLYLHGHIIVIYFIIKLNWKIIIMVILLIGKGDIYVYYILVLYCFTKEIGVQL